MIRIAIIDDDQDIRNSLAVLIKGTDGLACVGDFENCENAIAQIAPLRPDVILMDIQLPGMSGIEGVKAIKAILPETDIIMLTISDDERDVFDSLCAGACGFLKKNTPPARLIDAIREAVHGGAPMSMNIARLVVSSFRKTSQPYELTEREKDVLQRICEGKSYKTIGTELFIDINTVKFHIKNIYKKLHVNSKGEAIAKAMREKIV